jgi:hypothetical protein
VLEELYLEVEPGKCFNNPIVGRFTTKLQVENPIVRVEKQQHLFQDLQAILEMGLGGLEMSTKQF